jgi:hypothetical protein
MERLTLILSVALLTVCAAMDPVYGQGATSPAGAPGPTMRTLEQLFNQNLETQQQTASGVAWISSYAGNFSGVSAYTLVSVVNASTGLVTITISFYSSPGFLVASTNKLMSPSTSWVIGTTSALSNPITTGDFEGYCTITSSTGTIADIFPYAALTFPVDGSTIIGNSLATTGFTIPFYSKRPPLAQAPPE